MLTNTKRSKLKVVFYPRQEEIEQIRERAEGYAAMSDEELIDAYNRHARIGMFGVRAQCTVTLGLWVALKKRFGDSVVRYEDGVLYCSCTVELAESGALLKTEFMDWE